MKKQTRFFKVFVKLSSILIVLLISDIAQALSNEKSNIATNGISEQQKTAGKRLKRSSTTGSIQVIISPDEAVLAGAKWSIDSGASWNSTDENITYDAGDSDDQKLMENSRGQPLSHNPKIHPVIF